MLEVHEGPLPVEIFAAKDSDGNLVGLVVMAVPKKCGLMDGDILRVDGLTMIALRDRSVLPLDFAALTARSSDYLKALANTGRRLAVGEFTPSGLIDAYFVDVIVH